MKITVHFTPDATVILGRIKEMPARMARAIAAAHDRENQYTIGHIQRQRLSGDKFGPPLPASLGILRTRTNRLRGSLRASKATITERGVESSIGTNVKYAGIHEFGGDTAPHTITARKARALTFQIGGRTLYRRSVKHPGSKIPARAPIRRGIEDRLESYKQAISEAVVGAVNIA